MDVVTVWLVWQRLHDAELRPLIKSNFNVKTKMKMGVDVHHRGGSTQAASPGGSRHDRRLVAS
jgi:hypothetical protein